MHIRLLSDAVELQGGHFSAVQPTSRVLYFLCSHIFIASHSTRAVLGGGLIQWWAMEGFLVLFIFGHSAKKIQLTPAKQSGISGTHIKDMLGSLLLTARLTCRNYTNISLTNSAWMLMCDFFFLP